MTVSSQGSVGCPWLFLVPILWWGEGDDGERLQSCGVLVLEAGGLCTCLAWGCGSAGVEAAVALGDPKDGVWAQPSTPAVTVSVLSRVASPSVLWIVAGSSPTAQLRP